MQAVDPPSTEIHFPPADFVRRGPPTDPKRRAQEKWGRVKLVLPVPANNPETTRYDFVCKGPFMLPLAVRRKGTDLGSRDAWRFFTHPFAVFPPGATFFNAPGEGCLGARIFSRNEKGVCLYDEVGAGIEGSEMVAGSFHGALGVLRRRVLLERDLTSPLAQDILETDLDLLEVSYLCTSLLRISDQRKTLQALYALFQRPTVSSFAWDLFSEDEQSVLQEVHEGRELDGSDTVRFRVSEGDFTQITDVRDARGRQAILGLLGEWEAFEAEHGTTMHKLAESIRREEGKLEVIRREVALLRSAAERQSSLGKLFSRHDSKVKELKAEAVHALRAMRNLEATYGQLPGYSRLQGLTRRIEGFQTTVRSIYRLAANLNDHNVTRAQIRSLRGLVQAQLLCEDEESWQAGYQVYDRRLRAEVIHKLLSTFSISAYILRRPDSLRSSVSRHNVLRINTLAKRLIEYFHYARFGSKRLGTSLTTPGAR